MSFQTVLKQLRLQDQLTQEELAKKLGVAKSLVSMWENGERKPRIHCLFCDSFLGVVGGIFDLICDLVREILDDSHECQMTAAATGGKTPPLKVQELGNLMTLAVAA